MALNIGSSDDEAEVLNAINTTPLVDVMLVLLIIFLIAIPVAVHSVPVQLPTASNEPNETKPENITLAIDAEGNIYWNDGMVGSNEELVDRMKEVAVREPQPEFHIRGDRNARFEFVGRVIVDMQRAGILKIAFVSEPEGPGGAQ